MKKQIKKLSKSMIEIEVEIPAQDWEVFLDEAARELSAGLKVAGFRPGNMPRNIVEREIGSGRILERGAELAARKTYVKIILEDKIEAIGSPKITILKMAAGNPLVFKAEAVVIPEVNLADYKKIAQKTKPKKKEDIKVEEKEMSDSLEWLRKSRAKYITMARPARLGDRVEIDFSAHGGPASSEETGQNQTKISESKNHPLILGKSRFIKGFDENLVDMKEKEEKNFSLMFPEDYHQKHLAGKLADFKVKMNLVQEQELPELNDEFAKGLGGFENLEKLKENIREGILMEKETEEKKNWQEKIISEIIAKSSMDLPDLLVESEAEKMLEEAKINVGNMGLPWENYLEQAGKTEQALKKELQVPAEKRVKGTLILREIAKQEKIETSDEEMEKEMNTLLKQFPDPEAAKKQIDIEQLKSYTYEMIRNRKVFELLESIAN